MDSNKESLLLEVYAAPLKRLVPTPGTYPARSLQSASKAILKREFVGISHNAVKFNETD